MKSNERGVTLLELMITVACVAIIAGIAYPSYQQQIMRSNRSEARNELMQAAQALERCYTHDRSYVDCAGVTMRQTQTAKYMLSWNAGDIEDHKFTITATAIGAQAKDADCFRFQISEIDRKAFRSDDSSNDQACWR